MTDLKDYAADSKLDLPDLSETVAQTENTNGTLVAISNDGKATLMTIDRDKFPAPAARVRLIAKGADAGKSQKVCEGTALVKGSPTEVVAVRP